MGNHDERAAYSRELFGEESDAPQDRVYDVAGLRIVSLDTSVPGWHHGEITDEQLAWLRDVLATPAEHGTILALHHPPIPSPMVPVAEMIELLDTDRLAAVLRRQRRPRDPRWALPLHVALDLRRHPGLGRGRDLLPVRPRAARPLHLRGRRPTRRSTPSTCIADRVVHTIVPVPEAPEVERLRDRRRPAWWRR